MPVPNVQEIIEEIELKDTLFISNGYDRKRERGRVRDVGIYGNVLDAGIGDCHTLLELMNPEVTSIVSVDNSSDAIIRGSMIMEHHLGSEAHDGDHNVKFILADLTHLPFPDSAFDCSVAVNTLHHIPDWKLALSELLRVTKDIIVVQEFSIGGKELIDRLMIEQNGELRHSHEWDEITTRMILEQGKEILEAGWSSEEFPGEIIDMLVLKQKKRGSRRD